MAEIERIKEEENKINTVKKSEKTKTKKAPRLYNRSC